MEKKKIAGCLFLDSGKILLVKRAVEQCWELPGGKVEEGEEPEVAALREAVEEINVKGPESPMHVRLNPAIRLFCRFFKFLLM